LVAGAWNGDGDRMGVGAALRAMIMTDSRRPPNIHH